MRRKAMKIVLTYFAVVWLAILTVAGANHLLSPRAQALPPSPELRELKAIHQTLKKIHRNERQICRAVRNHRVNTVVCP